MLFNVPVTVLGAGSASPATFLVATVALVIFAVGYIEMARHVTASGGFYSFVSHGFGQIAGTGTAALIVICYMIFSAALAGVVGYFANSTIQEWFGVDIPAWAIMIFTISLITGLAWFHIEFTSKLLGVFLLADPAGLAIFAAAVLIQGGDSGLSAAPLNPTNISGNSDAVSVFGAGAAGIALFGAFWSWVGFEMAPNYAEESRSPRKLMASADLWHRDRSRRGVRGRLLCLRRGLGVARIGAGGLGSVLREVRLGVLPLTTRYVGSWLTYVFEA